jgi:hypothetical protein
MLKAMAFTFPLLLGFWLLGVDGGSLLGRRLARRTSWSTQWFLVAQAAVGLYAGRSVAIPICALRMRRWLEPVRRQQGVASPLCA